MSERLSDHLLNRRILAVPVIGLAGLTLSACLEGGSTGDTLVAHTTKCLAYNLDGQKVEPVRYPLGNIRVIFDNEGDGTSSYGQTSTTNGIIEQENNGNYYLYSTDVKDLSSINELYVVDDFAPTSNRVAVAINTPITDEIGFTTGCLSNANYNGIPAVKIDLPSNH